VFALVTDLLDAQAYPALDLARAYPMPLGRRNRHRPPQNRHGPRDARTAQPRPESLAQQKWALFAVYQATAQLIGAGADATGIPPEQISFRHALTAATDTVTAFPPCELDLALATFLLKILDPAFRVRHRPNRTSPRKTKKAGDYPARKPHEPTTTHVTHRIQLHLLQPARSG
jgi:hypothetical protein